MNTKLSMTMGLELTTTEKIKKIGNSFYINIRKDLREKLGLNEDDLVELTIKKVENKKTIPCITRG